MLLQISKLLLIFLPAVFTFSDDVIKSISYFDRDNIKFICLLTCGYNGSIWNYEFTKVALNHSMIVSFVNIDNANNNKYKVEKCLKQTDKAVGVVIDPNCEEFENVVTEASQNKWLDARHKWVIPTELMKYPPSDNGNTSTDYTPFITVNETNAGFLYVKEILKRMNLSVDADISIWKKTDDYQYDIFESFNFGKLQGGELIVNKIGSWNQTDGLVMFVNGYKYYNRWDFGQWVMRMSIVFTLPPKRLNRETIVSERPVPGMAVISQIAATILHEIADVHNFRFKYSRAEVWIGQFDRNSSARVVSSGLYYEQQDISPIIRYLPEIHEHNDIVHPPVSFIETKFYYRIPTRGPGKLENQFLTPFSYGAWFCVIAVTVLCTVVLLLSAVIETRPESVQYAVFSVLAAFCQQFFEDNANVRHSSGARKLTVLVTGLSCVLLYNYYTSSVVSWLLSGPPPSINSLRELLESPLELILEDVGYSRSWVQLPGYYYFNTRNAKIEDELREKKIYNKKRQLSIYKTVEEGIEMVKAGGYAFSTEADNANRLISRKFTQPELCELGSLQSMEKTYLYTCLQKNSPYKEFFVWSLARLAERGIISCIKRRTRAPMVQCEGSAPRALALGGAAPAFVLLVAGYALAVVILFIERAVYKLKAS